MSIREEFDALAEDYESLEQLHGELLSALRVLVRGAPKREDWDRASELLDRFESSSKS